MRSLTITSFTSAYICTIVDGHEDVMILLTASKLLFMEGHPDLTLIRQCSGINEAREM